MVKDTEKRNVPRKELFSEYSCLSYSSDFSKHFIYDIDLFTIMLRFFILFFVTSMLVSAFYASPAAKTAWPHSMSVCLQICVHVLFTTLSCYQCRWDGMSETLLPCYKNLSAQAAMYHVYSFLFLVRSHIKKT